MTEHYDADGFPPEANGHGGSPHEGRAEQPELYRVAAAHVALGLDGEDVQRRLEDSGVFPAPEPAHRRDTPEASALEHDPRVPLGVHDLLAARFQQERTARRAAEEELESARRLIGQGPFVIVKLSSLNALTDEGQVGVTVACGGGVTSHMCGAVLSLGVQAVQQRTARGEQGDTVRLP